MNRRINSAEDIIKNWDYIFNAALYERDAEAQFVAHIAFREGIGVKADIPGSSAFLYLAAKGGNEDAKKLFREVCAGDPRIEEFSKKAAQELLKHVGPTRYSNIFMAALGGTVEDVRYFVEEKNINVNSVDHDETSATPLHLATHNPNIEVLKYLISKGADVNAVEKNNATPLHSALLSKNHDSNISEVLKYLISKGADVNAKANNGLTPKDVARNSGKEHILLAAMPVDPAEEAARAEANYNRLVADMDKARTEDKYQKLANEFRKMNYKDSSELARKCENTATEMRYNRLVADMNKATTESEYQNLTYEFRNMNHKDSSELARKCENAATEMRYNHLVADMNKATAESEYQHLANDFRKLNYKNSTELSNECESKYLGIKNAREARERIARERVEKEKAAALTRWRIGRIAAVLCFCIGLLIPFFIEEKIGTLIIFSIIAVISFCVLFFAEKMGCFVVASSILMVLWSLMCLIEGLIGGNDGVKIAFIISGILHPLALILTFVFSERRKPHLSKTANKTREILKLS